MEVIFIGKAEKDLKEWKQAGNILVLKRVRKLIDDIQEKPFEGIGKPEPLRFGLTRRITEKNRIVYEIYEDKVKVYSLKGHYEKNS